MRVVARKISRTGVIQFNLTKQLSIEGGVSPSGQRCDEGALLLPVLPESGRRVVERRELTLLLRFLFVPGGHGATERSLGTIKCRCGVLSVTLKAASCFDMARVLVAG